MSGSFASYGMNPAAAVLRIGRWLRGLLSMWLLSM
jgi:hypothetical protein